MDRKRFFRLFFNQTFVKKRLDHSLLELGLAESNHHARGLIMAGKVLVDDQRLTKVGTLVTTNARIRLSGKTIPWVSRGGLKLDHALDTFKLNVKECLCLDVGASTGGFTDVLLNRGAAKVYALDVGYGQLSWTLSQDSRVVVLDRTNIRTMDPKKIPVQVDILTIDVSFISLSQALPSALNFLRPGGEGVALLKPQFELKREKIADGGVVLDPKYHQEALELFEQTAQKLALHIHGSTPSPITGPKGNREFLFAFTKTSPT